MFERIPVKDTLVDISYLGSQLILRNSSIVRNRFIKAPLTEKKACFDPENYVEHGSPNEKLINIYSKWGNGQFGIIVSGNILVDSDHLESVGNVIIEEKYHSNERQDKFKALAKAAKSDGSLFIGQLNHCGRKSLYPLNKTPYSSSDIKAADMFNGKVQFGYPIVLTKDQIQTHVIDKFVYSAKYLFDSGFDGVELNISYGFLLASFVSEKINTRTDEYGGSFENRFRIIAEIYKQIRAAIPSEGKFIIAAKISPLDFPESETSLETPIQMAKEFEKLGFEYVHISGCFHEKWDKDVEMKINYNDYSFKFAKSIKDNVSLTKVFRVGGFRTVSKMVDVIRDGICDGISIGRPATQEPDLSKKILEHGVLSLPVSHMGETDFRINKAACWYQMDSMGLRHYEDSNNNACADIPDLSNQEVAEGFVKQLAH
uniref:Oxidored_FMN domain-containing protein n=1 Tax=Rhabditophanes sp. KR3021 TaxID=114890 RepID=A0AC35TJ93_9BILA